MRYFLRWWETLGKGERIVAMSLATGGIVAIANSTAWAIAVSYMARQKALVAMAGYRRGDAVPPPEPVGEEHPPTHLGAPEAAGAVDGVAGHAI